MPAKPTIGSPFNVTATGGCSGNAVTFSLDPSTAAGACTISGSTVTFTGVGLCAIDANQAGNPAYLAAAPVKLSILIGKTATTVAPSASATTVVTGASVTLSAAISAGAQATGSVTFMLGGAALGVEPVVQGVATLSVNNLPVGNQTITVVYSGDATFAGSTNIVNISVSQVGLTLDPNVGAVVNAQVQAGQRYMSTQIDNTFRRVEQLHDEAELFAADQWDDWRRAP